MRPMIPDGAHSGTRYAVMAWDEGDESVDCLVAGPSLGEARKVYAQAKAADPPYAHVAMVKQTVTHTSWEPATRGERLDVA